MIYFAHLPEVASEEKDKKASGNISDHPHLIKGVVAQFFYVGAQVGVGSFVIRFVKHSMPDTPEKMAARFLVAHQLGFMIGRFAGSAIMKRYPAPKLLSFFGFSALACVA